MNRRRKDEVAPELTGVGWGVSSCRFLDSRSLTTSERREDGGFYEDAVGERPRMNGG